MVLLDKLKQSSCSWTAFFFYSASCFDFFINRFSKELGEWVTIEPENVFKYNILDHGSYLCQNFWLLFSCQIRLIFNGNCKNVLWKLSLRSDSSGVFASEIKGKDIVVLCFLLLLFVYFPCLLVSTEYWTQPMVICCRIIPACFLDSDPGFQHVLFVLCSHANQCA